MKYPKCHFSRTDPFRDSITDAGFLELAYVPLEYFPRFVEGHSLYSFVDNIVGNQIDVFGLLHWGWPPWGPPPTPPTPPSSPAKNPCDTWKCDKEDDPFKASDCANCCEYKADKKIVGSPFNPKNIAINNWKKACQAACVASDGATGPNAPMP